MTEMLEHITPEMSEEEVLGFILDEIMARAEPDVAEAIRFCAIPRWFNEEIIAWLRREGLKPSQRSREILAALTELTFVGPYPERGWAYHENVRGLLLKRWRERDGEEFEELSGQLAGYFGQKAEAAPDEERDEWESEQMYHLLAANPKQGFELLKCMFNRAHDSYQLSTCAQLLQLAGEKQIHLRADDDRPQRVRQEQLRRQLRVFVSSTWSDLQDERQAVEQALRRMRTVSILGMEYFGSRPDIPREVCLEQVSRSDVYVGVFAHRYGYIDPESGLSMTELEYRRARECNIPCLIYMKDESVPVPLTCVEREPEAVAKLRALKQDLLSKHVVSFFTNSDNLAMQILAALDNFRRRVA